MGNPADFRYLDWHATPDIAGYITNPDGDGLFTVDTYCEEAILDRRGSLQMSRCGLLTTELRPFLSFSMFEDVIT